MKAFVIGDKDVVLGFQLVGIQGISVSNKEEASEALRRAASTADVKIVFITEDFSAMIYDGITAIRSQADAPFIVEMPGRGSVATELYSTQKLLQKMLKTRV